MSKQNGDRSRFQRIRKATLLRRLRARATHIALKAQAVAAQAPTAPATPAAVAAILE
jgi:hypothetical protein